MSKPSTSRERQRVLRGARRVLRRRYAELDLALADVAAELEVSARQLQRVFHEEACESFRTALLRLRMERAVKLLERGVPAYQVAPLVGYRRPSGLRHALLRWYGRNASDFQSPPPEYLGDVTFPEP